jgi:hypothetical protein
MTLVREVGVQHLNFISVVHAGKHGEKKGTVSMGEVLERVRWVFGGQVRLLSEIAIIDGIIVQRKKKKEIDLLGSPLAFFSAFSAVFSLQ